MICFGSLSAIAARIVNLLLKISEFATGLCYAFAILSTDIGSAKAKPTGEAPSPLKYTAVRKKTFTQTFVKIFQYVREIHILQVLSIHIFFQTKNVILYKIANYMCRV